MRRKAVICGDHSVNCWGASTIAAADLHRYYDDKVAGVRAATIGTTPPSFTLTPLCCELRLFSLVSKQDIVDLVRALPDKQCISDPLPTWLLKDNIDLMVPFLCRLINSSLSTGIVLASFKSSYITPLLKKADLDSADLKSYRPISNLSVISKLLERIVAKQLIRYLKDNDLLPDLQSAYRSGHSTETTVLKVLADILQALDAGDFALLILLDLSAAFDSVDHPTLLERLHISYDINDVVLLWFSSYLLDRQQHVRLSNTRSEPSIVLFGVPRVQSWGPSYSCFTQRICFG